MGYISLEAHFLQNDRTKVNVINAHHCVKKRAGETESEIYDTKDQGPQATK